MIKKHKIKIIQLEFPKEVNSKEETLRKAYAESNDDPGQIEAMKDWKCTIGDGLDDCECD